MEGRQGAQHIRGVSAAEASRAQGNQEAGEGLEGDRPSHHLPGPGTGRTKCITDK